MEEQLRQEGRALRGDRQGEGHKNKEQKEKRKKKGRPLAATLHCALPESSCSLRSPHFRDLDAELDLSRKWKATDRVEHAASVAASFVPDGRTLGKDSEASAVEIRVRNRRERQEFVQIAVGPQESTATSGVGNMRELEDRLRRADLRWSACTTRWKPHRADHLCFGRRRQGGVYLAEAARHTHTQRERERHGHATGARLRVSSGRGAAVAGG